MSGRRLEPVACICVMCGASFESLAAKGRKYCDSRCKERARYAKHGEARKAQQRRYNRENRGAISTRRRVEYRANRALHARRGREQYLKNRPARIAYAIEYQRIHPLVVAATRHRRRATSIYKVTARDLSRSLARHQGRCAYCSAPLAPWGRDKPNSLQWDHVVPLSRGGAHSIANLVPSCRDCNTSKSASLLVEWLARAGLKDPDKEVEDLQKAIWYLNREVGRIQANQASEEAPASPTVEELYELALRKSEVPLEPHLQDDSDPESPLNLM